ncbi:MAG: translation initiation factor IF-6 [Thermoplasmata archaeon]|nr:translation initiation factor IF-6 [Thermoplasmata archaeon]
MSGSPYVGVYLRVSERAAVLPPSAPVAFEREFAKAFRVRVVRSTVGDSEIVGALTAINSHGIVAGAELTPEEQEALETIAPVVRIRSRHNALGNNILVNDLGALVHPEFGDEAVQRIGRAFGVTAQRGTVAGLGTVGMAAIATNRGVVVHPKATESEAAAVGEALKVPVARSTANFGIPVVGACLVANSRALLVGRATTPVEIVHLQEGLQIFD